jgi:hypothetical protein
MTETSEVPPFMPVSLHEHEIEPRKHETEPMVVMTVRIAPAKRDAVRMLWRRDSSYNSVSHIIQLAVDEFLANHL